MLAPYEVPNLVIEGNDVLVNKPKVCAYRAPGAPQSMHAMESAIDELARRLGMDPIDLRLRNAAAEGTVAPYGPRFPAIGLRECLEAAKAHPNYTAPVPEGAGRGVAVGFWFNIGMQSRRVAGDAFEVRIAEDGAVTVMEGSPDIGGSRASMALMAAETLGGALRAGQGPRRRHREHRFCNVTGGSRTTFATGMAVVRACEDIIAQCRQRAALTWDLDEEQVDWVDGEAVPKPGVNADVKPLSLADIARGAGRTGGPLLGRASLNAQGAGASFSCNFTDAIVDTETGKVDVLGFTAVQDAGRAIHPSYVEGQMQGGAVQGIGWALNEEYIYDDNGVMENAGFLDYRVPVASDMPMIDTGIVEVPNPFHPYGVRGVGETPIVAPLAAVSNAVRDQLGFRIPDLPLSPPRVLAAIDERGRAVASDPSPTPPEAGAPGGAGTSRTLLAAAALAAVGFVATEEPARADHGGPHEPDVVVTGSPPGMGLQAFCEQNPYHEICGYGGGGGMLTCPYSGMPVSNPEDCPEFSGGGGGGGGGSCANSYSGDCGSGDDGEDEEDEVADESPGCWEGLVEGEAVVTSGFQTDDRPDHNGVDLRCATGTNVYAAEAGTVTRIPTDDMLEGTFVEAGLPGSGGNMVVVTYESGRVGRYMHLLPKDRQGIMVGKNEDVAAGQLLGACNDTGHSYGPHLHYDLKEGGQFVNPVEAHDCE